MVVSIRKLFCAGSTLVFKILGAVYQQLVYLSLKLTRRKTKSSRYWTIHVLTTYPSQYHPSLSEFKLGTFV